MTSELLDSDCGTPAEISGSLSDLRRINSWFGGVAVTESMVLRVSGEHRGASLSLLEVAAGDGTTPRKVQQRLLACGIRLEVTVLDRAVSHLTGGLRRPIHRVAADALALPFSDSRFDLVSSCLFAHHFSPDALARAVNEALRVCRIAVLINDLVRSPVHLALTYAAYPLYRSRLTRHDAPASVRQAYTVEEMEQMLGRTAAAHVEIRRHYLFRMGAIAWKALPRV